MDFEIRKTIKTILENMSDSNNVDLSEYTDEDFLEVFFEKFRPWVKSTHGEEAATMPMSFLTSKYIDEFARLYISRSTLFGNITRKAVQIGRAIVEKGERQLTSLRPQYNFLEKYTKPIKFFMEELNLPDFVEIKFSEPKPYYVKMDVIVDFEDLLKYDGDLPSVGQIGSKFKEFLTNYLGIDLGKATYGGLNLETPTRTINKYEDRWVKDDLNKIIKKEIKKLPSASSLRGIKFIPNDKLGSSQLQMLRNSGYYRLGNIKTEIENLLSSLGYNRKYLYVVS
jgi:hypothetical protein